MKRIGGFRFKLDEKLKGVEAATSKPTIASESSSDESLSQLSDSDDDDDDLFDDYVDRNVLEEELRSWTHHSPPHEKANFLERSSLLIENQIVVATPISAA